MPPLDPPATIGARPDPALTICIPAYRAARFLGRSLDALRRQTFRDFQVILSNDGGFEAGELEALCPDPGITVIHHKDRLGWVGNMNWLIARVETPFFAILPHDDAPEPRFYAALMAALADNPAAAVAISDIAMVGLSEDGNIPVAARPHTGPRQARILDVLRLDYPGISMRGVNRRPASRAALALLHNPVNDLFADSTWIMQQAVLGEIVAVAEPLYRKYFHDSNTHTQWATLPSARIAAAWWTHCVQITAIGLLHTKSPQQAAQILQAGAARCLSARPPSISPWINEACLAEWGDDPAPEQGKRFQAEARQVACDLAPRLLASQPFEARPAAQGLAR